MDVKIHTQGWAGCSAVKPGEKPGIQFNSLLEIDGTIYDEVGNIRVLSEGGGFTTVMVRLLPSTIEYVNHDADSWKLLTDELQTIRKGAGWSLSVNSEEEQ
jgi:hypothetical protein